MARLEELDLPERLAQIVPRWVTAVGVGLIATGGAGVVRLALDALVPGAAAFPMVFPAVVAATLLAGWIAGSTTAGASFLFAWYYFYPVRGSFRFESSGGAVNVLTVALALMLTVALAQAFRRAVRRTSAERDRQIADRDLLLVEFDHRVKNNFALVASLLDLQRRRAREPDTVEALGVALARVDSMARAHRHLYRGAAGPGAVDMAAYLEGLCAALAESLFLRGAITLQCVSDSRAMPRDQAVSLGLVVNELVTNAAKHAFEGRETGCIRVAFASQGEGWCLSVSDDGRGMPPARDGARRDGSGLGQRLVEAFARQAGGRIETRSGAGGTTVTVARAAD